MLIKFHNMYYNRILWSLVTIPYFSKSNIDLFKTNYSDVILELKTFNFTIYPENVKYLMEYRWKPIIIALELQKYPALFWMDSSIAHKKNMDKLLNSFKTCENVDKCLFHPWILIYHGEHSIYAATHKAVRDFSIVVLSI